MNFLCKFQIIYVIEPENFDSNILELLSPI